MSTIYITGHRNPDFDSTASATVYAHLKNRVDPDNNYVAVRCGNLNAQTRNTFGRIGIEPPIFLRDVKTTVADVVNREIPRMEITDPLQTAIALLDETGLSLLPVFDSNGTYQGTVSGTEISHFLMRETIGARPIYHFLVENLAKVVPGHILLRSDTTEFDAPVMIGAMPFERCVHRMDTLKPTKPLFVVGLRRDLLDYAISQQFPAIILTGASAKEAEELDFSHYEGSVYLSDVDTAETIRLLRFSTPILDIIESGPERLETTDDFDRAKRKLSALGRRGLPVFEKEQFIGIVSRGSFLDRPRKRLIMVDHNEIEQSIPGARDADILEIVDHHRVGAVMSREPFSLYTRPVGCTCTILRQLFRQHGVAIPEEIAKLMLSAILSDTVLLKSPTTTDEDRQTVDSLARHAGVDWLSWGSEMFALGDQLTDINPDEAVMGDFKVYDSQDTHFGIGQVEVQAMSGLEEVLESLNQALMKAKESRGLDGTMLLITDVMSEDSVLLIKGLEKVAMLLHYETISEGVLSLPGILSRKKQLLPEVMRAIEESKDT